MKRGPSLNSVAYARAKPKERWHFEAGYKALGTWHHHKTQCGSPRATGTQRGIPCQDCSRLLRGLTGDPHRTQTPGRRAETEKTSPAQATSATSQWPTIPTIAWGVATEHLRPLHLSPKCSFSIELWLPLVTCWQDCWSRRRHKLRDVVAGFLKAALSPHHLCGAAVHGAVCFHPCMCVLPGYT